MTANEADALHAQVKTLSADQLVKLWKWIYLEWVRKVAEE